MQFKQNTSSACGPGPYIAARILLSAHGSVQDVAGAPHAAIPWSWLI